VLAQLSSNTDGEVARGYGLPRGFIGHDRYRFIIGLVQFTLRIGHIQ
jgi:hypothetical protein